MNNEWNSRMTQIEKLRVLLVEDMENDALLILRELQKAGFDPIYRRVDNKTDLLTSLPKEQWQIVLSDYQMPQFTGIDAFEIVHRYDPDLPFIIISGTIGEDVAVSAMRAGVQDYLMKGQLKRLGPAVRRELHDALVRRERRLAGETIKHLNNVLRAIRNVNQLIVREKDPQELLQKTCNLLIESRGYNAVWIVIGDGKGKPFCAAQAGWGEQFGLFSQLLEEGKWPMCCSAAETAENKIVILDPEITCPQSCKLQELYAKNMAVTTKLFHKNKEFGFLSVSFPRDILFEDEEKDLLIEVTGDISFALHTIELEHRQLQYARIVENSTEAMALISPQYTYLQGNPSYLKLVNWTRQDIAGQKLETVLGVSFFEEEIRPLLDRCLAGEEVRFTTKHQAPDSTIRTAEAIYAPCFAADGLVTAAAVCIRDVTEQRQAEQSLIEREERYRALAMQSPNCLILHDLEGHIIDVNEMSCRTYGYSREELLHMNVSQLDPDYEIRADNQSFYKHMEPGQLTTFEARQQTKEGREFPVEVRLSLVEIGGKTFIQGLCNDISEQKKAEETIHRNERLLSFAIEQIPVPVIIAEAPDVTITRYNQLVIDLLAKDRDDLSRITLEELHSYWPTFYPDGIPCSVEDLPLTQAIKEGKVTRSREIMIKQGDKKRWIAASAAPLLDDSGTIIAGIFVFPEITDLKNTVEQLRDSEEKLHVMLENIGIGVALISHRMEIIESNKRMQQWFPSITHEKNPICYKSLHNPPKEEQCQDCPVSMTLQNGTVHEKTTILISNNEQRTYRIITTPVRDKDGDVAAAIELVEDITEQLALQEQLRQSQKLEAIGQLAGGIAHDYNNMLNVILGYGELALEKADPESTLHKDISQILNAGIRSRDITRQLLTFARRQLITPSVLDLNQTIENMLKMLQRLLGENITLEWKPSEKIWNIWMDPSQLDQILINLCVNARDAIEDIGSVTISTGNSVFDDEYCKGKINCEPGEYVFLKVRDDGAGMTKETRDKIFEPFFTTKKSGKGTGLGLATIYGIVHQNKGFILVSSSPGNGASFTIFVPRHSAPLDHAKKHQKTQLSRGKGQKILVVEDEQPILNLIQAILTGLGYVPLLAETPTKAIAIAEKHSGTIDLIITDVIMPEMNGKELSERLISLYPKLKRIYISGHSESIVSNRGICEQEIPFINKPFSASDLANLVQKTLDS